MNKAAREFATRSYLLQAKWARSAGRNMAADILEQKAKNPDLYEDHRETVADALNETFKDYKGA